MKKINNLVIGAVAFVVIILIALISISQPEHPYELSQEETLEIVLASAEMEVIPEEIKFLKENSSVTLYIIDLRSQEEFGIGHIEGAMNIPQSSILEEENMEFFQSLDSTRTAILYGRDQIQANGPWMILKQLGIDNVKVLKGGYQYYSTNSLDIKNMPKTPAYMIEFPQY
ncbi:MAG TPA: rhodanese-like domain-containing protein, partial [Prolixibacteraceae bacterium]|nr:rhodanese-like domain-containing protein [Prolixibacteraceae bacterium]